MQNNVLILDFGSQYTQLIARRVRELNIFCEIKPFNNVPEDLSGYKAVILSGSPFSVRVENAPHPDLSGIRGVKPILGICYGAQYIAHFSGGNVAPSETREYGRARLAHIAGDPFFRDVSVDSQVWMSHSDTIQRLPEGAELLASTHDVENAAFKIAAERIYGIQFHPEVYHTTEGKRILENFLVDIAGLEQTWTPAAFVETTVAELKEKIGNDKVILGLSGGVDSTVAAVLLHRAIGKHLPCIFVTTGLLRQNDFQEVLEGCEDEAYKVEDARWLGQGTIYPDVSESVSATGGPSATIKSHHNVGGLPDFMKLKVVEPLKMLFKDEVRRVGTSLGIPEERLGRHPFPGPGLAIRILGDITREKVALLQEVDHIFVQGLMEWGLYDKIWQAGAILLPVQSVGVMGDERTYEKCVVLRAVESTDGMTADWVHLPYEFMQKISNDIINKVPGVNRVVYDISSKPPATIEWE